MRGENRRRARSMRTSTDEVGSSLLPSSKLRRLFKGASSQRTLNIKNVLRKRQHPMYPCMCRATLPASCQLPWPRSSSKCKSLLQRHMSTTCYTHVKRAIANNGVAVCPQKFGGSAMPSHIEKRIANVVRKLRERKLNTYSKQFRRTNTI